MIYHFINYQILSFLQLLPSCNLIHSIFLNKIVYDRMNRHTLLLMHCTSIFCVPSQISCKIITKSIVFPKIITRKQAIRFSYVSIHRFMIYYAIDREHASFSNTKSIVLKPYLIASYHSVKLIPWPQYLFD